MPSLACPLQSLEESPSSHQEHKQSLLSFEMFMLSASQSRNLRASVESVRTELDQTAIDLEQSKRHG